MELNEFSNLSEIMRLGKKMVAASYAPYSTFTVGCVVVSDDDQLFSGCNVENASYSLTVCAAVSAICNMVSDNKRKLKAVFIFSSTEQFATPCGGCRQTILEFSGSDDIPIFTVNSKGESRKHLLSVLIPHAFNAETMSDEVSA